GNKALYTIPTTKVCAPRFIYAGTLTDGTSYCSRGWGMTGDQPVAGRFDWGDINWDLALIRPSTWTWYVMPSHGGLLAEYSQYTGLTPEGQVIGERQWGVPGDVPVVADYGGDGVAKIAVWRPSNGYWYMLWNAATCAAPFNDGGLTP